MGTWTSYVLQREGEALGQFRNARLLAGAIGAGFGGRSSTDICVTWQALQR